MKANIKHKNIIGIYCIKNKINGKCYVGETNCIYRRMRAHITGLNTKSKNENIHLINSWHKYGRESFIYSIIEECKHEELRLKETYWISKLETSNRELGYNLRIEDDKGKLIVSEETKTRCSLAQKKRFEDPEQRKLLGEKTREVWANTSLEVKERIKDLVSSKRTKYIYYQYTKKGELVNTWYSVRDILKSNPTFKRHNIYAACSGEKPSIYGYKWQKVKI